MIRVIGYSSYLWVVCLSVLLLASLLGFDRRARDRSKGAESDLPLAVCLAILPLALVPGSIRKHFDEVVARVGELKQSACRQRDFFPMSRKDDIRS